MALQLAQAPVLPYSLTHMISVIEGAITELQSTTFVTLRERGASEILDVTLEEFQKFKAAAEVFSSCQNGALNDELRLIEYIFDLFFTVKYFTVSECSMTS